MALISNVYSDSDDDDVTMNDDNPKQTSLSQSKPRSLPMPFAPMPPKVTFKKKRSYGNYEANCVTDRKDSTLAIDAIDAKYRIQSQPSPTKKRRELNTPSIPKPTESIFNSSVYSPVIKKKSTSNSTHAVASNSLHFKPRQIKPNTTNVSTEDLGNMWSKANSKQFTDHYTE